MQRDVFERLTAVELPSYAVHTISSALTISVTSSSLDNSARVFIGCADGSLGFVDCNKPSKATVLKAREASNKIQATLSCSKFDPIVRKPNREKKPTLSIQCIEAWGVLLGIFEGTLCSYDLKTLQQVGTVSSTSSEPNIRGVCSLFAVHEKANIVSVACSSKKKLYLYHYNQSIFVFRREVNLVDFPKSLLSVSSSSPSMVLAVVGFKKFYDSLDLSLAASTALSPPPPTSTRLLDVEKEHKMVSLEV